MFDFEEGYALLTNNGIDFDGRFYSCSLALKNQWFSLKSESICNEVTVYYAPDCLNCIYIINSNSELICCNLLPTPKVLPEEYLVQYYARFQELKEHRAQIHAAKKGNRKWL